MAISGRQWYSPINGPIDRDHPELHHQEDGSSWFRISQTGHLIIKGEIQNEDHRYRQFARRENWRDLQK
jgi:hypothetical protein